MLPTRTYRSLANPHGLVSYSLQVKETDLLISSSTNLRGKALRLVQKYRRQIEGYIERHPEFRKSLTPLSATDDAPLIVRTMMQAAAAVRVGPMASVAGAIAEFVGKELLQFSPEVIIENGGDIFLASRSVRIVGIYAGDSPFSGKLGIEIDSQGKPVGVCTSSGTVGHSLSLGRADAAVLLSDSATLADAAATCIGNAVRTSEDIPEAINTASEIPGISGALIIKGDKMGSWGKIKLCSI